MIDLVTADLDRFFEKKNKCGAKAQSVRKNAYASLAVVSFLFFYCCGGGESAVAGINTGKHNRKSNRG